MNTNKSYIRIFIAVTLMDSKVHQIIMYNPPPRTVRCKGSDPTLLQWAGGMTPGAQLSVQGGGC